MFNRVLVANRGEIALRVLRACRELGIHTIVAYSEPDASAPFVKYADEAFPLGGAKLADSYLNITKILDIAETSDAEAIHPGYGLLSENSAFAEACEKAGIVFVGPPPAAMRAMGGKAPSRELVRSEGIPVIPGSKGIVKSADEAREIAEQLGYPIIVKASAGGGGIGMKVVNEPNELSNAFDATQRMATASFGDGRILVEKYLPEPRHVEIQIAADRRGRTIHLDERECSVQRRYQKLLEETPSQALVPELRERMGDAAIRAAKAAGYQNLGTVEFVVSKREFYFLEMNTRLQVEHPITELTHGLDLVHMQLRIAAGEEQLPSQSEVESRGHAIECRINAEDPSRNFIPTPGAISTWAEPAGPGIRVDSGVTTGSTVSFYYDPLLAKLVVWGEDREAAIGRMRRALAEFVIEGVKTTIPFHRAILAHPAFRSGEYNTHIASLVKPA